MRGLITAGIVLLFLSVLVHELCHWLVARLVHAEPATIVLGPLGGLTAWPAARSPKSELGIFSSGPLSNLLLCALCIVVLQVHNPALVKVGLFDPLYPPLEPLGFPDTVAQWEPAVAIGFWINWLLFLLNLLPAFPFDGGRMLRATLLTLKPDFKRGHVAGVIYWVAVTLAMALMAIALVVWKHESDAPFPTYLPLIMLSVILLVSARRDVEQGEKVVPGKADEGRRSSDRSDAPEPASPPVLREAHSSATWAPPTDTPDDLQRQTERDEELQVDRILSRLHTHGLDSLTAEERALLQRVSARYRNRLGKRT
jgi:Zn-dependent protease